MNCSLILGEVIRECRDLRKPLYLAFFDVKSAFDVVFYESLLRKLFHIGIEGNTWTLIHSLHQDAESVIKWSGEYSDKFKVQQGAVLLITPWHPMTSKYMHIYHKICVLDGQEWFCKT